MMSLRRDSRQALAFLAHPKHDPLGNLSMGSMANLSLSQQQKLPALLRSMGHRNPGSSSCRRPYWTDLPSLDNGPTCPHWTHPGQTDGVTWFAVSAEGGSGPCLSKGEQVVWHMDEEAELCILLTHNIAFFPSGNAVARKVGPWREPLENRMTLDSVLLISGVAFKQRRRQMKRFRPFAFNHKNPDLTSRS